MKKLIYILLLFLSATLSAQYTATHQSNTVTHNGSVVMIQSDDIPTSPENPIDTSIFETILVQRFDQSSISVPGDYTNTQCETDFRGSTIQNKSINNGYTRLELDNSDTCLVLYIDEGENCNASWFNDIDDSVDHVDEFYLSVDIQYKNGFQQNYGGKGIGIYCWPSGTTAPDGSGPLTDDQGWSSRLGWEDSSDDGWITDPGYLQDYVYSHGLSSSYGIRHTFNDTIEFSGEWRNIIRRYVMNTPGTKDGLLEIFLDGECVYTADDLMWRTTTNSTLDFTHLEFSLYFGGNPPALRDEYVKLDNVFLGYYKDGIPGSAEYPDLKSGKNQHSLGDEIPIPSNGRTN